MRMGSRGSPGQYGRMPACTFGGLPRVKSIRLVVEHVVVSLYVVFQVHRRSLKAILCDLEILLW